MRSWSAALTKTGRRLPKDTRWDAEAVTRVKGSPFGTEFDPVNTEPVDRPQARPALAMPFRGRHKDIVQFGTREDARGAVPQEQDSGSRLTMKCAGREYCRNF